MPTPTAMQLSSKAFPPGGDIPAAYTSDGANRAPPLTWANVPPGTKSLALIVDDPDAPDPKMPRRTWVHWVVYNLPPNPDALPEGGQLPQAARDGINDFGRTGYGGPSPPVGRHRYFFKLYALDEELPYLGPATKADVEKAMEHHVLSKAELVGTYQKRK
jgi:Raf kinase inhibitor-like YbhB/YbcL family protein